MKTILGATVSAIVLSLVAPAAAIASISEADRGPVLSVVGAGAPVTFGHRSATFAGGKWLDSSLTSRTSAAPQRFGLRAKFQLSTDGGIVEWRGYSLWVLGGRLIASGPVSGSLVGPQVTDGRAHTARILSHGPRVTLRVDGERVDAGDFAPVSGSSPCWVGFPTSSNVVGTISHVWALVPSGEGFVRVRPLTPSGHRL
jgi:hypothetical protein